MGNDGKRWSVKRAHSFSRDVGILDNDERLIAEVFTSVGGVYRVNAYVRASNIVRAVNAHDALLTATSEMLAAWDGYEMLAALDHHIRERVEAAIALATEATDD